MIHFQAGFLNTENRSVLPSQVAEVLPLNELDTEIAGEFLGGPLLMIYRGNRITREENGDVQPLTFGDSTLTWDGRLDNRNEVADRAGLQAYESLPDATIVLRSYNAVGQSLLAQLVGEFALSLWNGRKGRLLLCRSHCGTRPLYYIDRDTEIVWSSDFAHLARVDCSGLKIDDVYILEYLVSQPDLPRTPFLSIRAVPAGSMVGFGPGKQRFAKRLWDPGNLPKIDCRTEQYYEQCCRALLDEAIAVRLSRSPGIVFSELSGGLDSSALVLLADQMLRRQGRDPAELCTLSCLYEESATCDETFFVALVENSRKIRGDHISEAEQEPTIGLSEITFTGLPSPHHCFPGRYRSFVSRMRRHNARLLLTGTGGDHLFWSGADGMPMIADRISELKLGDAHRECLKWNRISGIPYFSAMWRATKLAAGSQFYFAPALPVWLKEPYRRSIRELVWDNQIKPAPGERPSRFLHRQLVMSLLATTSAGYYNDAEAICVSHPYTHRPLVEFCLSIPIRYLQRDGESRFIMRRALRDVLPAKVLHRQSKGTLDECFSRALDREWELVGDVREWELCRRGYADPGTLLSSLQKGRLGLRLEDQSLIRACSLERWFRSLAMVQRIKPARDPGLNRRSQPTYLHFS